MPRVTRRFALSFSLALGALVFAAGHAAAATSPLAGPSALSAAPRAHAAALQGLNPDQVRRAYALPASGARGQTVAIVSAYDDPNLEADLAAYDTRFKQPSCTVKNLCIRKLNQDGRASPLPGRDVTGGTWVTESALGTEVVHGLCHSCRLLLVEANSDTVPDFSTAVKAAISAGATVVVTTFTPEEVPDEASYMLDFSSSKAIVVAATGDPYSGQFGYTGSLNFPAALPNVLAVGGTTLSLSATGSYGSERAWDGTVSGCNFYGLPAASWQRAAAKIGGCGSSRADADLAAVANPGAIVHIAGAGAPGGPWYVASGTSFSAPIIGAVIGLAGSAGNREPQMLYARAARDRYAFHDITRGENAPGCTTPICSARPGWDGPTGLGTPFGLEAFLPGGPALSAHTPRIWISASNGNLRTNRSWNVRLGVANGNAFHVSGSIVVRDSLRVGGRRTTIEFATAKFSRDSLASGSVRLTITRAARGLLRSRSPVSVWAYATVHGASGRNVTVKQRLTLLAP